MKKNTSLLFVFVIIAVAAVAQTKKSKSNSSKPNIIYILADDLGIGNVSCYGADNYQTPNIDKLAKEGMMFNHAYTAPLCGPSRALIMTGRYAFRTGAMNQDRTPLMKDEVMLPKFLKPAGYTTSMIGKWGQLPSGPAAFEFDDFMHFKGSGVYYNKKKKDDGTEKAEIYTVNGKDMPLKEKEYMPDLMHDHLMDFINKNQQNPFYIYYSLSHVHAKIQPTPDSDSNSQDLFADNIRYMDKLVGKLVRGLDSLDLRKNTLIIFFGDNGTANEYAEKSTVTGKKLSGKKGSMLECGSLVPMIANWPQVVPAGKVTNQLIDASDFFPTLAEITGAKLPDNKIMDGVSFAPQLLGKKGKERTWIFTELGNKWFVRDDKYKLNREGELFDMSNAPFEEKIISPDTRDAAAIEARNRLQKILENLNPAGGFVDDGNGSGRHAKKDKKTQ